MTAHIVFAAIDDTAPATQSRRVIGDVIRGEIGFDGVLVSDDISMGALEGSFAERTRRALDGGCDLALHCSGVLGEMAEIAEAAPAITADAHDRIARGEALRLRSRQDFDRCAADERFAELVSNAAPTGPVRA